MSAGRGSTCALRQSGEVVCWGVGSDAADGTPDGRFRFVGATTTGQRGDAIACRYGEDDESPDCDDDGLACALRESGEIVCWMASGWRLHAPPGQFRALSVNMDAWETDIGLFVQDTFCALRETGEIACWDPVDAELRAGGYGLEGRYRSVSASSGESLRRPAFGRGRMPGAGWGALAVPPGRFRSVSAGLAYACAIRETGELACWGYGATDAPPGTYAAVSAGVGHACAIRAGGELICWGDTTYGQTDAPPGMHTSVGAGRAHACAVRETGAIVCWGAAPADVPAGVYRSLSVSWSHGCALRETGEADCWAGDGLRQLDAPSGTFTSVNVGGSYSGDAVSLPVIAHACGLRPSGEIACWGDNAHGQTDAPRAPTAP